MAKNLNRSSATDVVHPEEITKLYNANNEDIVSVWVFKIFDKGTT